MINNLHLGIKFQCPDCDYEATAEGHMATHQKSVHLGIKFQCPDCDYEATMRSSLATNQKSVHMSIEFPCKDCDYEANITSNLERHQKSVHRGQKLQFDYEATQKGSLATHQTSDKTFSVHIVILKLLGKVAEQHIINLYIWVKSFCVHIVIMNQLGTVT